MNLVKRRLILSVTVFLVFAVSAGAQEVVFRTSGSLAPDSTAEQRGGGGNTYHIRVEAGMFLEAIAASPDVDTWIDVVLPDGTTFTNDDYDGLDAGFLRTMPASGDLVITVSALYGHQGGPYTLTVQQLPAPQVIRAGDRITGNLGKGSFGEDRRAQLYHYRGEAGDHVVVDLMSDDFDAFLEIIDQDGQTFFDDDGGQGFNSRLPFRFVDSGTITIIASSALGESTGAYELRVSEFSRSEVARYDGRLRAGGRRSYDGKLVEVYEYNGRAGQSVTVSLESDDFDTVLYLSYADGRSLAMDDDSGGNGNSLLDVVLPSTETYRIYVVPFSDSEGAYRLTIYE